MSKQQRETIDQMLRQGALDFGGQVDEQRRLFADLLSVVPLPGDVRTDEATLGAVPVVTITVDGTSPAGTILYLHGGAYADALALEDVVHRVPMDAEVGSEPLDPAASGVGGDEFGDTLGVETRLRLLRRRARQVGFRRPPSGGSRAAWRDLGLGGRAWPRYRSGAPRPRCLCGSASRQRAFRGCRGCR